MNVVIFKSLKLDVFLVDAARCARFKPADQMAVLIEIRQHQTLRFVPDRQRNIRQTLLARPDALTDADGKPLFFFLTLPFSFSANAASLGIKIDKAKIDKKEASAVRLLRNGSMNCF